MPDQPVGALNAAAGANTPTPLQPGQSAMQWLADTAKQRAEQAQAQRGVLQPQINEANAQAAAQVGAPRVDPALSEDYARSQLLAGLSAPVSFGSGLANANGAYQQAKMDEAIANAKRQDELRQQRFTQLQGQDRTQASDETAAMGDITRMATARAAMGATRFKNAGGILYDTQSLDSQGRPTPVTQNSPIGKLYQQMHAEVARRATGPTAPVFQSDAEREQWINDQTDAQLAKLGAAVDAHSYTPGMAPGPPGGPAPAAGAPVAAPPAPSKGVVAVPQRPAATPVAGQPAAQAPAAAGAAQPASKFAGFIAPVPIGGAALPPGSLHDPNAEKVLSKGQGANADFMAKYYSGTVVPQADAARDVLIGTQQLQSMQLPTGAVKNWALDKLGPAVDALRQAGVTDPGPLLQQSIAKNSAQPIIEKMRQNILQLARGVQTEGDAQRALSQIANLSTPQESFKAMLQLQGSLAQRVIDKQQMFDEYGAANNGLYVGAPQRWQAYSAATPVFTKDPKTGSTVYESQYVTAFQRKFPQATPAEAVQAWRDEVKNGK